MKFSKITKSITGIFKEEDSRFILLCGFKFSGIFLFVAIFALYLMWVILKINNLYFESYGFFTSVEFQEAFFDSVLALFYAQLVNIFGFVVLLFFCGLYAGKILLRPFEIIGKYSKAKLNGEDESYSPDIFSDYKLLTRFSEFFFLYLDDCMEKKHLKANTVPANYAKIRGPKFEKVFFFHFLLFIVLLVIIGASMVVYFSTEIHNNIVNLSIDTIANQSKSVAYFLGGQRDLLPSIIYFCVFLITSSYLMLSYHLYGKVSGAIFGFFATMRSFMRGNFQARVHLIGYAQIRPHGRALNKYLDHVERECGEKQNEVS